MDWREPLKAISSKFSNKVKHKNGGMTKYLLTKLRVQLGQAWQENNFSALGHGVQLPHWLEQNIFLSGPHSVSKYIRFNEHVLQANDLNYCCDLPYCTQQVEMSSACWLSGSQFCNVLIRNTRQYMMVLSFNKQDWCSKNFQLPSDTYTSTAGPKYSFSRFYFLVIV